jgi:hypothetical protein
VSLCVCLCLSVQVREHTSLLEAELEKHMAASSAECQNYAKEVAGVSPHMSRTIVPSLCGPCPAESGSSPE